MNYKMKISGFLVGAALLVGATAQAAEGNNYLNQVYINTDTRDTGYGLLPSSVRTGYTYLHATTNGSVQDFYASQTYPTVLGKWAQRMNCPARPINGGTRQTTPTLNENNVMFVQGMANNPYGWSLGDPYNDLIAVTMFVGGPQPPNHTGSTRAQIFVNRSIGSSGYTTVDMYTQQPCVLAGNCSAMHWSRTGHELYAVMAHEIGHALGVRHDLNPQSTSVMNPYTVSSTNWYARREAVNAPTAADGENARLMYGCEQ